MSELALYYPHLWMRDEAWLKAALLYWPQLARMVPRTEQRAGAHLPPPGGGPSHADLVDRLRDEELLVELDMDEAGEDVAEEFLALIDRRGNDLEHLYGIERLRFYYGDRRTRQVSPDDPDRIEWVLDRKLRWHLTEDLESAGLALRGPQGVGMHPRLAGAYLCAVADRLATSRGIRAVTDEPGLHAALSGRTSDTLAQVLLNDPDTALADRPGIPAEEVGRLFTVMAFTVVLPGGLDDVPLEKIIEARRDLGPELHAYRRHLDTFAERFAELSVSGDPLVLREHLEVMVRADIEPKVEELAHRLRLLGLRPVRKVLGMKTLAPEAAMAAVSASSGLPTLVSASGDVAACLVGAAVDARQQGHETGAASPTTYLVGLRDRLSPRDAVSLTRALLRRP